MGISLSSVYRELWKDKEKEWIGIIGKFNRLYCTIGFCNCGVRIC
ncbi:hypothetical protein HMPREF0322_05031 [Desulfitobacterium hafniense DP7]|uniref:Uncharacterized protein n=1 Tax=Desulfitobacterium hafniense DP7 TaxID=537010 RepID=G9XW47_DESHA|nr:hypothetical protein HMPREF0322_05031 [Desulfitobacterium hafniense DP7]